MNKRVAISVSLGALIVTLLAGVYIFSKLSHNKVYEKGLFVNSEVNKEYAGYIC